ncbi:hypothetical protein B7463_g9181, partial [Scytalidium lignicola]
MVACMILLATCFACTTLAKNYTSLLLLQFFLGVAEAPFHPSALYLLSIFYTRKEIAARLAILYITNIMSTAFSGLIVAVTFSTLDCVHGIQGWKWLFIIEGVVTFGVAIICLEVLPDQPLTTRWLPGTERTMAEDRTDCDTMGLGQSKGVLAGFKQAFSDPRLYIFALIQDFHLSGCGFNNFFPTVVGILGFDRKITLVITCPPFIFAAITGPLMDLSSGKLNERTWPSPEAC